MNIRIIITNRTIKQLEKIMERARRPADFRTVKRIMAVISVIKGHAYAVVASILKVSDEAVRIWMKKLLLKGPGGLEGRKPGARKPKLTKKQKKELKDIILEGPSKAGFFRCVPAKPDDTGFNSEKIRSILFRELHFTAP